MMMMIWILVGGTGGRGGSGPRRQVHVCGASGAAWAVESVGTPPRLLPLSQNRNR